MIKSFQDRETEKVFITGKSRKFPPPIIKTSIRKLDYINAAVMLQMEKEFPKFT